MTEKLKNFARIITFSIIVLPSVIPLTPIYAQNIPPVNPTASIKQSYNDVCGNKFKNDPKYQQFYKNLSDAQQYDLNNPQHSNIGATSQDNTSDLLQAGCPPSLDDITFIVLRVITILLTIVGVFALFNFIRAGFIMTTAGPSKEKIKTARGALQGTFAGLILIVVGYSLIVFVATRLGLSDDPNNFSILSGGNLIFKFIFSY